MSSFGKCVKCEEVIGEKLHDQFYRIGYIGSDCGEKFATETEQKNLHSPLTSCQQHKDLSSNTSVSEDTEKGENSTEVDNQIKCFTFKQVQEWAEAGLTPEEVSFAAYLQKQNFTPQQYFQQGRDAQQKEMTSLDIIDKNLKGSLNLNDFVNLQSLRSGGNQITSLDLSNFELDLRDNQFTDLTFLGHLENLEEVWLNNNPLSGGLEPLKNCQKLEKLEIENTNINSGLEYLPENLEEDNQELVAKTQARLLLQEELQSYQQKIHDLEKQLIFTARQKISQKKDFQNQLTKYQQDLQTQQSSLSELEQQKSSLEIQLNQTQSEILTFQEKTNKLQIELHQAQANYQQVAAKLDEDRDTNIKKKLELDFTNLNVKLQNNEKELSSKKQELVNTKQKLNELLYQEKSLEQTRLLRRTEKELNKKIESLEKGNAKLQGKLTAKEQEISRMNQTINQAVSTPKLNIEGSINVERGNALIDNVIGDNANITSHYTKSVEESEQQAQILHQPYGTPSSSKN
ncbi:10020_t:CDS:2 [Entrophospora sp. SA101]|nr:10020_t:CDS:2 [Entrophospora sp. SA101]